MIGYEMGYALIGIYIMAKSSMVKNFKHGWKNDMATKMTMFFC